MPQNSRIDNNTFYITEDVVLGESIVTTDETPLLVYSYPTLEQGYKVEINFAGSVIGADETYAGELFAAFKRPIGGDITKKGNDVVFEISSFAGGDLPTIYTQANISTQEIEVYVVGRDTFTVTWIVNVIIKKRA